MGAGCGNCVETVHRDAHPETSLPTAEDCTGGPRPERVRRNRGPVTPGRKEYVAPASRLQTCSMAESLRILGSLAARCRAGLEIRTTLA